MSVKTHHPKYDEYFPKWKRVRDVLAGQDKIHAAGTEYLKQLKEQPLEDYKAMLSRTPFFNASYRTVAGLVGMMFRKEPEVDIPTSSEEYLKDINMQGVPFNVFAEQVAYEKVAVDFYGVLADYPRADPTITLTVAQAETMGLRPTLQLYKAENIINWKFRRINNKYCLSMVVLTEQSNIATASEFVEKTEDRYRVLDLNPENNQYRIRLFRIDDFQQDELLEEFTPLMNGKPLDHIPFYFDPEFEEPPLIDLIDLNIKHFQVSATYEHGCHFTGLPTPVVTGYNPIAEEGKPVEKLYIGSTSAWIFPDPNADAKFLEFSGAGLSELRTNLQEKKAEMAVLGARMLTTEKAGVEAFKTQANRNVGETSILASIAIAVSLKLTAALKTFCEWAGAVEDDTGCEINREFMPVVVDAPMLTAWIAAWQSGAMSEAELFDLLKRGDVIAADKTLEEHQGELDAAPSLQREAGELANQLTAKQLKEKPEEKPTK